MGRSRSSRRDLNPSSTRYGLPGCSSESWVEPRDGQPGFDLFAAHPEWIYAEPGREVDQARGQYVLNLTLPEVREFIVRPSTACCATTPSTT